MALPVSSYLSDVWKANLFANRVVFCTGGAGSICSAQVRALVYLGANACIVGRNVEKTESMAISIATARPGAKVLGIGAIDVRSVESLNKAVERCVSELGGVDILIAGAAGNFLAPMTQLSTNAFKSVIDIDVLGSYNTVKACIPALFASAKAGHTPRIIFISATIHYNALPLQTHVTVAKAGVDALSASCSVELGPRGITSNVISPGGIADTEGLARLLPKNLVGKSNQRVPMGRMGTVRDIADATVFLCGEAGSFVNGDVLVVDGGAWRRENGHNAGEVYPDFLLNEDPITGVKGTKKAKL